LPFNRALIQTATRSPALNRVTIPVFETDDAGEIRPNPLFHRPNDQLHSRCVEYPYSASKLLRTDRRLLDVGSAKADPAWMAWLEGLPMEVHATDFDRPGRPPGTVRFTCADVRALPYPDACFDAVFAVSVIEHIGLEDPQVLSLVKPVPDANGDRAAVREIARVLRPGGRLILTLPFARRAGLILQGCARAYDLAAIDRLCSGLERKDLRIFEYRSAHHSSPGFRHRLKRGLGRLASNLARWVLRLHVQVTGPVTWEPIRPEHCTATNRWHVDAVACGVWMRPSNGAPVSGVEAADGRAPVERRTGPWA
jgi:SAM-dependent methyltransferase